MATKVQALKDVNGNKFYPKTTADAVAYDTTSSVKSKLANGVYCEQIKTVSGDNFPINATTLNGFSSSYFAKASDLSALKSGATMVIDDDQGTTLQEFVDDSVKAHDIAKNAHANLFSSKTFYVDVSKGDDDYAGTSSQPFKTIQHAINISPVTSKTILIKLKAGTYNEAVTIKDRLSCEISISPVSNDDEVIINNFIVADSCKNVSFSNLKFTKIGNENNINIGSIAYSNLFIYHSNFNISGCTFVNNDNNNQYYSGIYAIDSIGNINSSSFTGYKYAIDNHYGYLKCSNISGENNITAFSTDVGITIFADNCDIKFTSSRTYDINGGVSLNSAAAQWLSAFSDTNPTNAAPFHNSIYRGKDITNYLNDGTLFTRISNGTFDDLFIGDYFYLNDLAVDGYTVVTKKMVLCGFDTYLGTGDKELTKHHAVVMPAGRLFTAAMNDTDTTEGGYYNSKMHQEIMPKIATGIKTIIGDSHLITYRDILTNSNDTTFNNWNWYDITCRLCSEIDVYGSIVHGNNHDIGLNNVQLPIFKLYAKFGQGDDRQWAWLSTIASTTIFTYFGGDGAPGVWANPTNSNGSVRPRFLIG